MKTEQELREELKIIWNEWYECRGKDPKRAEQLYLQMEEVNRQISNREFVNVHATDSAYAWDWHCKK